MVDAESNIFLPKGDRPLMTFNVSSDSLTQSLANLPSQASCYLYQRETVAYVKAWQWQQQLVTARLNEENLPDILVLLEHWPVYTLGTGSNLDFVKFSPETAAVELHRTERGGEVTYHCPGQLVGYPILNLRRHRQDLHWYLRQLEEVLIRLLDTYGLRGERIAGLTGVWVEGYKVAAIGIKVKRWITMHGFALNVCPDLAGFRQIVPCGIGDRPVGSLQQFLPDLTLEQVRQDLPNIFGDVFQLEMIATDAALGDRLDLGS
ncbi:lipoyl(octanoyl) transferase LipB [Picosynechococcus sp. NKBG15041c]|uniref:lipoyl(octanoyl) transferase LipB n=1 Tax=Picosynechococcus sp. NKBG15041c TaxID=1407650 RepID=UPI000415D5FF|nr:lipoyl(octanoyl) transferase LipB [Picosynechococcus sp. NKBG15041c]